MLLAEYVRFILGEDGWLFAVAAGMTGLGQIAVGLKQLKDAKQQVDPALTMEFMMNRRAELLHGVHTILGKLVDPMFSPEVNLKGTNMREAFSGMKMNALWEFVSSMFPGAHLWKRNKTERFLTQHLIAPFPYFMRSTGTAASLGIHRLRSFW